MTSIVKGTKFDLILKEEEQIGGTYRSLQMLSELQAKGYQVFYSSFPLEIILEDLKKKAKNHFGIEFKDRKDLDNLRKDVIHRINDPMPFADLGHDPYYVALDTVLPWANTRTGFNPILIVDEIDTYLPGWRDQWVDKDGRYVLKDQYLNRWLLEDQWLDTIYGITATFQDLLMNDVMYNNIDWIDPYAPDLWRGFENTLFVPEKEALFLEVKKCIELKRKLPQGFADIIDEVNRLSGDRRIAVCIDTRTKIQGELAETYDLKQSNYKVQNTDENLKAAYAAMNKLSRSITDEYLGGMIYYCGKKTTMVRSSQTMGRINRYGPGRPVLCTTKEIYNDQERYNEWRHEVRRQGIMEKPPKERHKWQEKYETPNYNHFMGSKANSQVEKRKIEELPGNERTRVEDHYHLSGDLDKWQNFIDGLWTGNEPHKYIRELLEQTYPDVWEKVKHLTFKVMFPREEGHEANKFRGTNKRQPGLRLGANPIAPRLFYAIVKTGEYEKDSSYYSEEGTLVTKALKDIGTIRRKETYYD